MDGIALGVFVIAGLAYFGITKRYAILAFISGAGLGVFIGLLYAVSVVNRAIP